MSERQTLIWSHFAIIFGSSVYTGVTLEIRNEQVKKA